MKTVIDKRIPGLEEGIREIMPEAEITALEGAEISAQHVRNADALIVRTRTRCDASLLAGSSVRFVGTATIGTDHIDMEWCRKNGIRVESAPGCNAPAVMQYVASALSLAGFKPGTDTLGVIGKGNIGSLVAGLYRQAGTEVLVCDPPRKETGFSDELYLPFEEVLERSDAVTFHVPLSTTGPYPTRHLLRNLPERPRIIVNASRGPVIDPVVIHRYGTDKRFVIDTWPFEEEPQVFSDQSRDELIGKAFIATPHIAGYSIEGKLRATAAMLRALAGHLGVGTTEERITATSDASERPFPYRLVDVVESFNPLALSEALKANPDNFELLRSRHLRPEPKSR